MNRSVLILDCGATNVKACLVDESGLVLSSSSEPNETKADPFFEGGLIWDFNEIFSKLSRCVRKVTTDTVKTEIIAITATSFGVDGAVIDHNGSLIYPVISWQCSRTWESENNLNHYLDREWLFKETGLQSYHFNTINKLIWLKEHRPDSFRKPCHYVLMPSLILWLLGGELVTDATMAGTTMLTSLQTRQFSTSVFQKLGLNIDLFPPFTEPGTTIGKLSAKTAGNFGITTGTPLITAGHDTQFALIGSGAGINEPILSSGTWEILMTRSAAGDFKMPGRQDGITIELDAVKGIVDIGVQWVASGFTEWIGNLLYGDTLKGPSRYETMISEAEKVNPGADGVIVVPEIFSGGFSGNKGRIDGFTHVTGRAQIYRAALESLCYYTRFGMKKLKKTGNFEPKYMLCSGGGSRNSLWNQLRATILGLPVRVPYVQEATAVGAAIIAFTGLGIFRNINEASSFMLNHQINEFLPDNDSAVYDALYREYEEKVLK
ncbi:MAG TPA: L-fuculokinase [Bacteroidales bacterium]|nr:L-fuculokinase [Bacteroidales bacterium]